MAQYKNKDYLKQSDDSKFDSQYSPGQTAPHPGIYRCVSCGDEIGIAKTHTLPSQTHGQHKSTSDIKWKLAVMAQQT